MDKHRFYEPRELVKLGIVFVDEQTAEAYSEKLQEELEIAVGKEISAHLSRKQLNEFDQIRDPREAAEFLEKNFPSYRDIVKNTTNEYYENTKKERLMIPDAVSLAKGDLHKISVDQLFLKPESTGLLKAMGFETVADFIQRFNSVYHDIFREDEGKELFEMAVMLRYYCREDKKHFVKDIINTVPDNARKEERCSYNGRDDSIENLQLYPAVIRALRRAGIDTVEKLLVTSDEELLKKHKFSKAKVRSIRKALEEYKKEWHELPEAGMPKWDDFDFYRDEMNDLEIVVNAGQKNTDLLDELIGLETVKQQVRKVVAYAKMKQSAPLEIRRKLSMVLNMEFVGNPGTAKTTVARILAGIFYDNGLLSSDELIEVGRSDLVGRYAGETSIKTKEVFQKAKGKLLFIDEAYSLVEEWEGAYGDEAINTIVLEMENNRDNMIVIFAGYPDKMDEFFSRNPGLKSRVPFRIEFEDYTGPEMVKIAELEAKKRGFTISESTKSDLEVICAAANKQQDSGNGRFARNIVENAILNYALRNYGDNNKASVTNDFVLIPEDFDISSKREMPAVSSNLPDYLKAWETIWADTRKLA